MFGISFSELLLVGLVALLVLGPERLPGAARTAGLWVGRLKRSFNAIKQEVEREIGADEIRRQLHNEHILSLEEEARKIMQPLQPAKPPVVEPAPEALDAAPTPSAENSPAPAAEPAPVATAVISEPVTTQPVSPAAPVSTPAATAPSTPSATDTPQPPRAP